MIPSLSWSADFQLGIDLLRAGEFDEGLKRFDEAARVGGFEAEVFPSRREVLERLRGMEEAVLRGRRQEREDEGRKDGEEAVGLKDAVDDDKDAPRLFLLLSRLPDSHRAFLLTQAPLHFFTTDLLLAHAQAHLNRLLTSRNLIDFLPFEILSIIGRIVHELPNEEDFKHLHVGFQLIAVSRRWRANFSEDHSFWNEVFMGHRDTLLKLEAFASKAPVRILYVSPESMIPRETLLAALKGKLSSLETLGLHFEDGDGSIFEDLWDAFLPSLPNLHTLTLSHHGSDPPLIPRLPNPLLFPSLSNLRLRGFEPTEDASLWPLLQHVRPQLRSLHLAECSLSLAPIGGVPNGPSFVVHLPMLVNLTISEDSTLLDGSSSTFLLPNLEDLNLSWSDLDYHPLLFPPNNHPPNTLKLTSLALRGELVPNEATLVQALGRIPALEELDVACSYISDATIQALMVREGVEPCVPRLRKLNVEGDLDCTLEAVMRMVKSREKLGWMGGGRGALFLGDRDDQPSEVSRRWLELNLAELLLYDDR